MATQPHTMHKCTSPWPRAVTPPPLEKHLENPLGTSPAIQMQMLNVPVQQEHWVGERGAGTTHSAPATTSNKPFHTQSENITSPRNRLSIRSLHSFSNACCVYFDPHCTHVGAAIPFFLDSIRHYKPYLRKQILLMGHRKDKK